MSAVITSLAVLGGAIFVAAFVFMCVIAKRGVKRPPAKKDRLPRGEKGLDKALADEKEDLRWME